MARCLSVARRCGYAEGNHYTYVLDLVRRKTGVTPVSILPTSRCATATTRLQEHLRDGAGGDPVAADLHPRDSRRAALGVVRERSWAPITNLYVTPVTRLEFLLGKRTAPCVAVAMFSFIVLRAQAVFIGRGAAPG